jgi:predicted dehydrogenase
MNDHSSSSPNHSRRQFLHQSAALTAAAAPVLSLAASAHAAGSDTLRIGMVGCGGRCAGAALNAMTADRGARLVAMADLFADRIEAKRQALAAQAPDQVAVNDDHCFVGLDAFQRVIDCVDVVLIACAAKFHPLYMQAAIAAGKHVFVEKPHAIDPAGIRVVKAACELARQKKLSVLSGLHSRYHPAIRETIQRVQGGQIGKVVAIEENFIRRPYGNTERPKGWRELEVQYGNQYRFSWLCGDDVTQSLVHNLDRATWLLGETPLDCHGLGGRSKIGERLLGDVFDHHSVVYRYASGVRLYAFCRTTPGCYDENSSVILGSEGTAYPLRGQITGNKPWKFSGVPDDPYVAEHRALFQAIRQSQPLNSGDYMAKSTLVAIMGQLSCYSGQELTWQDVSQSDYCLPPPAESCTWEMTPPTRPGEGGVYPVCAIPGITRNV